MTGWCDGDVDGTVELAIGFNVYRDTRAQGSNYRRRGKMRSCGTLRSDYSRDPYKKVSKESSFVQSYLACLGLHIADPGRSARFYQDVLGMSLVAQTGNDASHGFEVHYRYEFRDTAAVAETDEPVPCSQLDLIYTAGPIQGESIDRSARDLGYWKIGVTLSDVDLAFAAVAAAGIDVSTPQQFLNIGYLCHLRDPDGYGIEFLQHRFAEDQQPGAPDPRYALRSAPRLAHISLRIRDPEPSLRFYVDGLGMSLLSVQSVPENRFTLYFLSYPVGPRRARDDDDIAHREWLWQRPYAMLELQHRWDGPPDGRYRVDAASGFARIDIATRERQRILSRLPEMYIRDESYSADDMTQLRDPDAYAIRLIDI